MDTRDLPEPLPKEWLPDPAAPAESDDPEVWDRRIRRLVAVAEPTLARYSSGRGPWWVAFGQRWRPTVAAALAAAAGLLIALTLGEGPRAPTPQNNLVLVATASESNPALVWAAINAETDPVLGLITVGGRE
jgi:hypothetical protein